MNQLKKLIKKTWVKNIFIFLLLLVSVWWAGKGIFKYNVFSTHDLDHHIARAFDAVQTFKEGHFPMRWAGSLNYFCGVPIYNFFYPLIYYLVVLINAIHPDIIMALKIIDFLSLLVGTFFFYFWMKAETKKEIPALGGALLYLYAPYRFSLIFVRGSPEFLAYAILPAVLYLYVLFFDSEGRKSIFFAFLASLTGALLAISHNFTVMFLFPIILVYLVVKSILLKIDLKKIGWLIFSFISSFGLSSFFIGPALLEKKFTRIGENFLFWRDHFPTLGQLIKSPWGYFYSSFGTANDGMSFMLGYAQWVILGVAVIWILYRAIFKRKFDVWIILTFLASLLTIYLILPWSIPVWEKIEPLQEIQFSWRLLGVALFTISSLFSFILDKINSKRILIPLFVGLVFLGFYGNRNHLLPQPISVQDLYRYADFEKFHPHRYSTTTLGDDVIAKGAPEACWFDVPLIATDKEEIKFDVKRGNTYGFVGFNFPKNPKGTKITTGLGYFPGAYKFEINGKEASYNDCGGRVCFDINQVRTGQNYISWKIVQTPVESFFNYLTLAFFGIWVLILILSFTKYRPTRWHFLLLAVFAIFAFLRFYNLDHRVGFSWDQERDAWAVKDVLKGDIKFIGPRVLGPEGFFLPPYFYYILAPFYALSKGHPFAVIYFLATYGISFFLVSFFALKKIFGKLIATIFLSLWAINTSTVLMDKWPWNPTLIPLSIIGLFYLLYRYNLKKSNILLFLIGLLFGLGFSFHVQFLLLAPMLFAFLYETNKGTDLIKLGKRVLLIVLGFITTLLPIFVFDLKNNFLNIKLAFNLVAGSTQKDLTAFIPVLDRFFYGLSGIYDIKYLGIIFYLAFVATFFLILKKFKLSDFQEKLFKGFLYSWILMPVFFAFYGSRPSEYYFNYLIPVMFLVLSFLLSKLRPWMIIVSFIALTLFWGKRSYEYTYTNSLSVFYKDKSVQFLSSATKLKDNKFNVSFDVPIGEDAGFRYLLDYYKVGYTNDPKDSLIEFVIPPDRKVSSYPIGGIGVYIPDGYYKK